MARILNLVNFTVFLLILVCDCQLIENIEVSGSGEECSSLVCEFHGTCRLENGSAKCVCELKCGLDFEPVCGSDGVTYGNDCIMRMQACFARRMITLKHKGICELNETSCGQLPAAPENSKLVNTSTGNYKVVCDHGYYRDGNSNLKCNKDTGEWEIYATCLKKACGHPGKPENSELIESSYQVGATVSYKCDECFYLDGPKDRQCLGNESWSGDMPVCKPIDCGHVIEDWTYENGFVFGQDTFCGSSIEFYCIEGYELVGSQSIVCQPNGNWSASPPTCQEKDTTVSSKKSLRGKCIGLEYPENGFILNIIPEEIYDPGHIITFSCYRQHELIGTPNLVCLENGTWSHAPPICKLAYCNEKKAQRPVGGDVYGGTKIGQTRAFFCEKDRQRIGPNSIHCQKNGQWSDRPPICKPYCDAIRCEDGKKCVYDTSRKGTKCTCMKLEDCVPYFEPVCGSDGVSYSNECLMKATACLKRASIKIVANSTCIPGGICAIKPTSRCRGYFERYYFDKETRKCKYIVAGGCHESGWNGFDSMEDCEGACQESKSIGSLCERPPARGPCSAFTPRWYHDVKDGTCKKFKFGGCFGNQNNFESEEDCRQICSSGMKPNGTTLWKTDCPPCQPKDLCDSIKTSDYALIGKKVDEKERSLLVRITKIIKDTKAIASIYTPVEIIKIPGKSGCFCNTDHLKGEIIITGSYLTSKDGDVNFRVTTDDFIEKYYGPKQFRCARDESWRIREN